VDPEPSDAVMVGRAMPPLWQYFYETGERGQMSPLLTPKANPCARGVSIVKSELLRGLAVIHF